jgi:hypothetical protein
MMLVTPEIMVPVWDSRCRREGAAVGAGQSHIHHECAWIIAAGEEEPARHVWSEIEVVPADPVDCPCIERRSRFEPGGGR